MASSFSSLKKGSKNSLQQLVDALKADENGNRNRDERLWEPSVDKAGNGAAVIRFLPPVEGETEPFIKMYQHAFQHKGKWFIENCPTTLGPNHKCAVCETNRELWASELESARKTVTSRKRNLSYYSNILVIKDPANPDNEGKVFLFRYGAKIFGKIKLALFPEIEGEAGFDPFNFWEGANFKLSVRRVEGYRNYDNSQFSAPSELLGGDDTKLEALWKSCYSLRELVTSDKFKSAEEIESKFKSVVGSEAGEVASAEQAINEQLGIDDDEPPFEGGKSTKPAALKRPAAKKAVKAAEPAEDVDDTDEYLRKLLNDN